MAHWIILFTVLIVLYVNLDTYQALTSRQLRKCKKKGIHDHLDYEEKQIFDELERVYKCKDQNKALNIPAGVKFECIWDDHEGLYHWSDKKNYRFRSVNLTCEERMQCPTPPPLPAENMDRSIIRLYMYNKDPEKVDKFYHNDTFQYDCREGFSHSSMTSEDLSIDDYDYYDTSVDLVNLTKEIICDEGDWKDSTYGTFLLENCTAITCNATSFSVVENGYVYKERDGVILNHTDIYDYRDMMRLECDEGYVPVDHVDHAQCYEPGSFNSLELKCKQITCPPPPKIPNGDPYYVSRTINSTVDFVCDTGYKLSGKPQWTCQDDGRWDGYCARCDKQVASGSSFSQWLTPSPPGVDWSILVQSDTHCLSPCVPEEATLLNPQDTYPEGSVVYFECEGNVSFGGSQERRCLKNRQWSGLDLDCTGKLAISRSTFSFKSALTNIVLHNNQTAEQLMQSAELQGKSFKENLAGGTDIFLVVDVSGSIDDDEFDTMKQFLIAVIQKLSISDTSYGTRLALYLFAKKTYLFHFDHDFDDPEDFYDKDKWEEKLSELTLQEARKKTGEGTDLHKALMEVYSEILTKQTKWAKEELRQAQQILMVISDGDENEGGKAAVAAETLKDQFELDIYSICISSGKEQDGRQNMKDIASGEDLKEGHFFLLPSQANQGDFNDVIRIMIEDADECANPGCTDPRLTNYKNNTNKHDTFAQPFAWAWMTQVNKDNNAHLCGGSLIDEHWILTAAHCYKELDDIYSVALGKTKRTDDSDSLEKTDVCALYKHPKYDEATAPKYLYDIALIRVKSPIAFSNKIHPVYLASPNDTDYEKTFLKSGTYGVVTGWGLQKEGGEHAEKLKQMQMEVHSNQTCTKMVDDKKGQGNSSKYYDHDHMICAGGEDGNKIVDTCKGDSGGPFVVPFPDDQPDMEDHFIQVGIVSSGIGSCKQEGVYGFYTKLDEEKLKWIEETKLKGCQK